ncbi:mitochondrial import inner membrane translocase subunit TIM44 isoform X2 [Nomia melanderi]|uniref:mitochondrial import inner membrane translocase subunit TIM44 isoform X2 n=1 Tax=Nomia melanderi TaxID=2448451 RepID=UPI00130466A2|nr:mitochondrial import inner membrane translocase subunit TIM44 isoform X2 [Nomia melanderi]
MFQRFAMCRASLIGATRSAQSKKKFGHSSNDKLFIYSYNGLLQSKLPQITNMQDQSVRLYSNARRPGFFARFVENIKQEMQKNKEMKESLKKFREEAKKLEQSDALKSARQKFQAVESEANKGSEVLKETIDSFKRKTQEVIEEASKSELGKKAKGAAETITEKGQALGKTSAFQTISQTAEAVREELDHQGMHGRVYVPPKKLRKRKEIIQDQNDKCITPNEEAMGVELHKDSKFYQSWQNFKDNNPYVHKVLDWKIKYEESDNPVIRASRLLTDKVTDVVSDLFQKSEISEALTEICKLDPNFDRMQFLKDCETDIIPNILEAMVRGDLEILKDWCHEAPYNAIVQPLKQAQKLGCTVDSKILDINNIELVRGKVMEQGPVLWICFQSQQTVCIRDSQNKVVKGDPEKVMRVIYNFVLCRDPTELNPKAAWRLLDISLISSDEFL